MRFVALCAIERDRSKMRHVRLLLQGERLDELATFGDTSAQ